MLVIPGSKLSWLTLSFSACVEYIRYRNVLYRKAYKVHTCT